MSSANPQPTAAARPDPAIAKVLADYLRTGLYKVPGYAHEWDLQLFADVLGWQSARGLRGDIAEIGVHHGRSFLVLALARLAGEKAVAFDLFEDDYFNADDQQHNNRGTGFFATLAKYNITLSPDEIVKGSSLDLKAAALAEKYQPFRFFSIDGGHFYHHVANDLDLAAATLADFGVICVDDWMNDYWPEVSIAAGNFLRDQPHRLAPFLMNQNKLYLCKPEYVDTLEQHYLPALDDRLGPIEIERVDMFGRSVCHVRFLMRKRLSVLAKNRFLR